VEIDLRKQRQKGGDKTLEALGRIKMFSPASPTQMVLGHNNYLPVRAVFSGERFLAGTPFGSWFLQWK